MTCKMELKSKSVFLTGGARGIGRGLTEGLLEKGARVLFTDINEVGGQNTEREFQNKYGAQNVRFIACDVTDAKKLEAVFKAAVSLFGAVDICVNNAGIMDERIWEQMIAVNTVAQIRGSQLALEHMRKDKGGRGGLIINTASAAGFVRCHWCPIYTATKHAIVGFTTSWANHPDLPAMGVRFACLCPMGVNTDLYNFQEGQVMFQEEFERGAASRMEVSQVVQAFMKLVQDEASNETCMVVTIKGGYYARRILVDEKGENSFPCDERVTDIVQLRKRFKQTEKEEKVGGEETY